MKVGEGRIITVDATFGPLVDGSGRVTRLLGCGVDVSDRKRAEELAREHEALLNEAQRIGQIGSWVLDHETGRLDWSDEIYRIFEIDKARFGTSYEAFLGAIHPEDREAVNAAYTRAVEEHLPYAITHRLLMAGGRVKHVRERALVQYDGAGKPLRAAGTVQDVTREVLAEQAMAIKDAAVESSLNAVALADAGGTITYVNPAFLSLWGYERAEEALGRSSIDFWESPDKAASVLGALLDSGGWSGRLRNARKDGSHRTLRVSAHLVRVPDTGVMATMAAFIDVTAQEETERRLARSEAQFRAAFEQAAIGMLLCGVDGRIQQANDRCAEITGFSPDELCAKTIWDLTLRDEIPDAERLMSRVVSGELPAYARERRCLRKDGTIVWVEVSVSTLAEGGRPVQVLGVVQDITQRRRAEMAVQRSEASLRHAERLAKVASWELDLRTRRLWWSAEMFRQYGIDPEEVPEPTLELALSGVHPDDRASVNASYEAWLGTGVTAPIEYRIVAASGEFRDMRSECEFGLGLSGKREVLFGFAQDITEAKAAESRIAAQLREKEVLLREIHHRVKNNLQVISSLLYLQAASRKDPEVRGILEETRSRVVAMSLVHETLYQSGDLGLIDFARYLQRLLDGLLRSFATASRRVHVTTVVTTPPLDIEHAVPCGLIVSELVTNALKYAFVGRHAGEIRVSLEPTGEGELRLAVADDGVGMPRGVLATSTTLGLRIIQALAKQLGGELEMGDGDGAELSVTFPYRASR